MKGFFQKKGECFLIVPSLESWQAQFRSVMETFIKKGVSENKAREKTQSFFESNRMCVGDGSYNTDDLIQKHYTLFELITYCEKANMRVLQWNKFEYKKGIHFSFKNLSGHRLPSMWDWFVHVEKK